MSAEESLEDPLNHMLKLSHELGREDRKLAILGEGNISAGLSLDTLLIKSTSSSLASLEQEDITECFFDDLIKLLHADAMGPEEINQALRESRVLKDSKKPSLEAVFHAYLLSLPDVSYVGHTHPVPVNSLLCTKHGETFASRRMLPDEVVFCGVESVFVPYADPGVKLAQAIRNQVEKFIDRTSQTPRIILLENHGLIALGSTAGEVFAATLMAVKAAEIYAGAAAIEGGPQFLTPEQIEFIANRPNELDPPEVIDF